MLFTEELLCDIMKNYERCIDMSKQLTTKVVELCENKLFARAGLRSFYPVDFRHRFTLSVKCNLHVIFDNAEE